MTYYNAYHRLKKIHENRNIEISDTQLRTMAYNRFVSSSGRVSTFNTYVQNGYVQNYLL